MSESLRKKAIEIVLKLNDAYPDARQELNFSNAFELLIATILAAQCTDTRVNQVTERLFKKYRRPEDFLNVEITEIIEDISSINFNRNKAKGIRAACQMLIDKYGGEVPGTVEELTKLPWVGRKTANIVLSNAMGIPAIGVDTHTLRVPNRLGWLTSESPDEVEKVLCELLPEENWHRANIVLQWHGRYTCTTRKPKCNECAIYEQCEWEQRKEQTI